MNGSYECEHRSPHCSIFICQDQCSTVKKLLLSMMLVFGLVGCIPGEGAAGRSQGSAGIARGTNYDPPKPLADFSLMSHTGKPLRFSQLQGRPVLVFFGYTQCPDICPLTLNEWTKVKANLGADADDVTFVFISVDGARDTPDVLAKYVHSYDASFVGLTGDEGMVLTIARDFGSYAKMPSTHDAADSYMVEHGSYSFLVNKQGQLQTVYSYGMPANVISKDILAMLQES